MSGRREIQSQHEEAVIVEFVCWLEAQGKPRYEIIARPNQPDAILQSGANYIWLEIADVYRSADEAHEERSQATPGETPFQHREHPIVSPDDRMAAALVEVVKSKISSNSYHQTFEQYGRGVLICCERDALFDRNTLEAIVERLRSELQEIDAIDRGFFKEVYLYERQSGSRPAAFHRLLSFTL